ncbi:TetR/AcrR family transcriptional regulator [Legionella waltersii]|uniref:TetR family transcriptional regulator n=1 Tax=Legionella waltersii TaxID=66969 RepID=A0A0W1A1F2_9GAMM|nr:TetR/AcrR family transcriptional regulator [Legionella waltersii]KTD75202.1 TetR family transcriptional regulator [Legionella waltersii]SNV10467.1 TetR family transcriptional regulator [Legionella waltersii]
MNINKTKERILTEAEALIQTKGYNAFSFKDIATVINIKTASIHYHFPSKEDLGVAVIAWHADKIARVLSEINSDVSLSIREKVQTFFDAVLSLTFHTENKMCLGGMFASDLQSLPTAIQNQVQKFFSMILDWLEELLVEHGFSKVEALSIAKKIIALIEGALLLARLYGDLTFLEEVRGYIDQTIQ